MADNIYSVAKIFLVTAKVFGIFPMSFVGSSEKGILQTKWLGVFCTIVSLGVMLWMFLTGFRTSVETNSKILPRAWAAVIDAEILINVYLIIYQTLTRKKIVEFLRLIKIIDDKVMNV